MPIQQPPIRRNRVSLLLDNPGLLLNHLLRTLKLILPPPRDPPQLLRHRLPHRPPAPLQLPHPHRKTIVIPLQPLNLPP